MNTISEPLTRLSRLFVVIFCIGLLQLGILADSSEATEVVKSGDKVNIIYYDSLPSEYQFISKDCEKDLDVSVGHHHSIWYYPLYGQGDIEEAGKYAIFKYDEEQNKIVEEGTPIEDGDIISIRTTDSNNCYSLIGKEYDILTLPWDPLYYSLYFEKEESGKEDYQRWNIISERVTGTVLYDDTVFVLQSLHDPEEGKGIKPLDGPGSYLRNDTPFTRWTLRKALRVTSPR